MRAYLSGGMEYVNDEGRSWREEMEEWLASVLGWEVFNPNRNSDELLARLTPDVPFRTLKSSDPERYLKIVQENCIDLFRDSGNKYNEDCSL